MREYAYYPGIDQPHAMRRASDGAVFFYAQELPGHVAGLVARGNAVVNQYTYTPWGESLSTTEQVPQPLRYAPREYDAETGLWEGGAKRGSLTAHHALGTATSRTHHGQRVRPEEFSPPRPGAFYVMHRFLMTLLTLLTHLRSTGKFGERRTNTAIEAPPGKAPGQGPFFVPARWAATCPNGRNS